MLTARMRRLLVPWAFLLVLAPVVAFAQTGAASITGLITDETGATLPGVTVTATNQGTNVPYTAVSNGAGSYTITSVPVGAYVIKVELSGFRTSATKPVALEARQVARLDFKMNVGAIAETVEVTGVSTLLQTETVTVGEVISGNTATALPLNGRNASQLALLLPGTVTPNPAGFTGVPGVSGARPYVNGNREQTNNYTLDGLDVNETIDNGVGYQASPDAVAEVSVETNNYTADMGNVGGAVISAVLKSGTNTFRGNAFEFYRNSDLDANSWENNRSGAPKPERRQDIYGGTFGGPLMKDKLFVFGDYQGARYNAPGAGTASVAPGAWRQGDLSSITTPIIDPLTGLQFPGNIIPAGRISAVARALLSNTANYPLPNAAVAGVTGNYVGETLTETRAHQGDVRIDWNASPNDKFFGRYSIKRYNSEQTKAQFPLILPTFADQPFWNVGFNWNRIFGNAIVNEALVGYSSTQRASGIFDWAGIGNGNATYGIAGGQPIAGLSSIVMGSGLTSPGNIATNSESLGGTLQINEKLTWLKGRHAMKFGGQWLRYSQQRFYAGNNGMLGSITYNGAFTGVPFADFLLDMASGKGRGGGDPNDPWTQFQNRIGLFAQDDFKVTPALTLNLGLRWAYTSPLVEKDNRQTNFDLKTGRQIFAQDGSVADRATYEPFYNGWEPRLGVAWKITDRLVARGGYGISQFLEGTGANLRLPLNPPFFFESNVGYNKTTGSGSAASGFADLIPGTTPTGQVRAYDPQLRPQFTQQYNAFVEYQLSSSMSAQVGYVGNRATHLIVPMEGNQALPGVGDPAVTPWAPTQQRRPLYQVQPLITQASSTFSNGHGDYNSLQASVRRRNVNGLEFMASYTLSKANSNNRGFYGSSGVASEGAYWQNAYDSAAEYGPTFFDVRHNFVFSASYELPIGKGRAVGTDWNTLIDSLFGGWRLSGILQARTGFPVTIIDGRNRSLQSDRGNERPNCVGDWKPSDQSITKWLDISGFQTVPLGTFGNCPVGVARAPGYWNADLMFGKRFNAGASRYFEFRIEAFNVFNHPNMGPPARDISNANTFGLITSTIGAPRVIELAFKFNF